jgi:hypothetical protein
MTETPTTRIRTRLEAASSAVLDELRSITDPAERQAAARTVLESLLPAIGQDVKGVRADAVTELRQGRTLAEVGQLLGGMSTARVDQILKGR